MTETKTTTEIQKFCIKFYVADPGAVALSEFIPVFHKWIQFKRIGGLLIDVADYSHVPEGPGVVLIGHEADYFMDTAEGPLGLLYNWKRGLEDSNAGRLRAALIAALTACRTLEKDPTLKKKGLTFQGQALRFIMNDRLHGPNSDQTLAAIRPDLDAILDTLYPGQSPELARDTADPRSRFTVDIKTSEAVDVSTLLERLG